ncbi:Spore maturation protein [Paenibacillus pasadenensis]|uniref:Spore maturation protein n=1 Tax=Paenibacillus pasadenensis TaxID=217090 RepID=A0A2N5N4A3_9BACL|nr:glycosyltransferase [Paenibacillus pasadenensis]PLT45150.1 Spore maturation protein [Paenibacillus pasadenensis]
MAVKSMRGKRIRPSRQKRQAAASVRRSAPPLLDAEVQRGREAGFAAGMEHGLWYGKCEAGLSRLQYAPPVFPIHVLFVATAKGYPYSPLDSAIADTLRSMTARVSITDTQQPVVQLAKELRPDAVIVLDGLQYPTEQVDAIRVLGIRTAVWFTDDPYYSDITRKLAPHYDFVFTLESNTVEFYRQLGCPNVTYLPLGVNPAEFRPRNPDLSLRREISFVGSAYHKRVDFFNQITPYLATRDIAISGLWWERLRDFRLLQSKIRAGHWMDPMETAATYNGAKIVINMHRAHDDETFNSNSAQLTAISPNPRTFEISACGTLQLTDVRDDLARFYEPGVEIATYASPQELVEKIDYYLNHEEERQAIAFRGMCRTMKEHTYAHRLTTMLSVMFPS